MGARVSASCVGESASDTCSAPSEEKSSFELRHCSTFTLSKVWFCSALTSSGSNGAQRPVVPKVPSRVARPGHDAGAGQQPLDDRAHGGGAQQQRLVAAAAMQDAVGEDVAALEIGRDLDFIDGEKRHVEIARHRLHRGDPEPRLWRLYLL